MLKRLIILIILINILNFFILKLYTTIAILFLFNFHKIRIRNF